MLEPSWLGRRVSVRRVMGRNPDGRPLFGDVVGDLVRVDASVVVIDTRGGAVEFPAESITLARIAPPSSADELALQRVAASGWRAAEVGQVGGWVLRATSGFTRRANSVLPLGSPGLPLDDALAHARTWYAERGLRLKLLIPTEARRLLDAGLAERGWPVDLDVHTMAARLDQLRAQPRRDVRVEIAEEPDEQWFGRYQDGSDLNAAGRALLTRHDAVGFAAVRDGERAIAIGRGTVDEGWLGVTAVEVDPTLRRAGLAATIMTALWRWGRARSVLRSYLQVGADNVAAVSLYTKLGYWVHHDYRYRSEPQQA